MKYAWMIVLAIVVLLPQSVAGQEYTTKANPLSTTRANTTQESATLNPGAYQLATYAVSEKVKFLRFNGVDDDVRKTISEDAAIFNHMVSRKLPLKNSRSALGVKYTSYFGQNEVVYNDQGLTFVYHVPYPLISDKENGNQKAEKKPLSEWEKAKGELTGRSNLTTAINASPYRTLAMQFNVDVVNELDEVVRSALTSAANIRNLKEDDSITVFVYGHSNKRGKRSVKAWRVKMSEFEDDKILSSDSIEKSTYVESSGAGYNTLYAPSNISTKASR